MAEFPGSVDCFVDASRVWTDQNDHAAIVLHCTASADPSQTDIQLGNYFETNAARVSTHYGIDRTGAIAQYCLEKDGAAGNGILDAGHDPFWDQYSDNPNWHSLSVECENDINNSLPLTDPQKQTLFRLIKYWVDKYDIPPSNIKGHFTLEPVERHDCPGPQFPWDELFNYLQPQEGTMTTIDLTNATVASHFSGTDNTMWQCKDNGFVVGHAILDFYRSFGGTALCGLTFLGLPTSNEQGVGHPGVVYQRFERGILCYDPGHVLDNPPGSGSVYLMHIDSGIGQDPRIAQLQSQITDLQGQIAALQAQLAGNALAQENAALLAKIAQAVKDLQ